VPWLRSFKEARKILKETVTLMWPVILFRTLQRVQAQPDRSFLEFLGVPVLSFRGIGPFITTLDDPVITLALEVVGVYRPCPAADTGRSQE